MNSSKGGHVVRRAPRVQSIKREKKSHLGERSPKIRFLETLERGEERILRRFLRFCQSEVVDPRVTVLHLNEGYT